MLYNISFTILDFIWAAGSLLAVVIFGFMTDFQWIRGNVLAGFLFCKLMLGYSFTVWTILIDVESDSAGYYRDGLGFSSMLLDLLKLESIDYLTTTPFWWHDGSSTDRFSSLAGLFLTFTGNSYLAATSMVCLLGAIGQLLIYRFFRERFSEVRAVYFLPLLFHPSLMMWSGMLLKDSMGIFALGGAVYSLHRLLGKREFFALGLLAASVYVILLFRSFILLPLVAFALFLVWDQVLLPYTSRRSDGGILKVLFFLATSLACAVVLWTLVNKFGNDLIEDRREGADVFSQIEAGSSFENVDLSFSAGGILALGFGAINSLFRPFPWDVFKPIQAMAALENLMVIGFVWVGFNCYRRRLTPHQRGQFSGIFWGMLVVALIIATGVGLFASNSGTISRYRIPMIPFLVAVPGLALGMADNFSRRSRQFTRSNVGPQPVVRRTELRPT